jgi:Cysteine rich repeat
MSQQVYAFAFLTLLFFSPHAALAEQGFNYETFIREAWRDCADDRKTHCSGIAIGGGRIVKCLVENVDKLSRQCRQHVDVVIAANRTWQNCEADIQNFCSSVPQGSGRILACLAGNKDRISSPCLTGLKRAERALKYD